jgi:hypothetical protein
MRYLWGDHLPFMYTGGWLEKRGRLKLSPSPEEVEAEGQHQWSPPSSPPLPSSPPTTAEEYSTAQQPPTDTLIPAAQPPATSAPAESTALREVLLPDNTLRIVHTIHNSELDMELFTAHIESITDYEFMQKTVQGLQKLNSLAANKLAQWKYSMGTTVNIQGKVLDFTKVPCTQSKSQLHQEKHLPLAPVWHQRVDGFSPEKSFNMPGRWIHQ